jgi:Skp family chaperone for outer membrane proteins
MTITANEMREMAKKFYTDREEKELKEANDYVNTIVEPKIKERAKKGSYSCVIDIPLTIDNDKVENILTGKGFEVRGLGSNKTIEW